MKNSFFSRAASTFSPLPDLKKDTVCPDFLDYLAIQNVLSLYCVAVDSKSYNLLEEVFTDDVVAEYEFSSLRGVDEVVRSIASRLTTATTHHALSTQHINFPPPNRLTNPRPSSSSTSNDVPLYNNNTYNTTKGEEKRNKDKRGDVRNKPNRACVMTYFTITYFGKPPEKEGLMLTVHGKYIDELVKMESEASKETGVDGQWRICKREVKIIGCYGDEEIKRDCCL